MLSPDDKAYWIERARMEAGSAMLPIIEKLNQELRIDGYRMVPSITIGIAFLPLQTEEVDAEFLKQCGISPEVKL